MDWIKVKTNHILFEYNDLTDSEFRAWIKIMALAANLEHGPSESQICSQKIHYKTFKSLQDKLNTHSTTLQEVLNKVSMDVQDVLNERRYWKTKKREKRAFGKNVHMEVPMESTVRLDKIRLDKNNINMRFWKFWNAYPRKKSKGQAEKVFIKINPDEQLLAIMIAKIEQAKKSDSWKKENGQFIPYPATWLNAQGWEDEETQNQTQVKEYVSEKLPNISDNERKRNLEKLKRFTQTIGKPPKDNHAG